MSETKDPYSNLKIVWHKKKIDDLAARRISAPIYVRIKPTNRCNHKCFYCSYADTDIKHREGVDMRDEIKWNLLEKAIDDMSEIGVKAVTFSGGGEPLIYPKIKDAMKSVLNKGLDLSIITNGEFLCGEKADILSKALWVRVSMDSCSPKIYGKLRNVSETSFDKVSNNIKQFAKIKPDLCELGVNFVVNHLNASEVYKMAYFVKNLGVNHIKFTAMISKNLQKYHEKFKMNVIEQLHNAKKDLNSDKFRIINKYEEDFSLSMLPCRSYDKCFVMQLMTVIAADSNVYMCHDKAYVSNGILGSLKKKSFKDIWFSEETATKFKNYNPQKNCKHHCVYDDRNILIGKILDSKNSHMNFI